MSEVTKISDDIRGQIIDGSRTVKITSEAGNLPGVVSILKHEILPVIAFLIDCLKKLEDQDGN